MSRVIKGNINPNCCPWASCLGKRMGPTVAWVWSLAWSLGLELGCRRERGALTCLQWTIFPFLLFLTSKLNPSAPDERLYTNLAWPYTMVTMVTVNTMYDGHTYLNEVTPTSKVVRVDEWVLAFTPPVLSLACDKKIMCETWNSYTYSKLCAKLGIHTHTVNYVWNLEFIHIQ